MKKPFYALTAILITISAAESFSQVKSAQSITASELESHVTFLASPVMKGRMNGEESLDIAANYIASQASLSGLKPANGNSYFQPFTVIRKKADPQATKIDIVSSSGDTVTMREPFFHILPQGPAELNLEGEVIFAGYGIKSGSYNDLENLDIKGKIVIVMNNGPVDNNGQLVLINNC